MTLQTAPHQPGNVTQSAPGLGQRGRIPSLDGIRAVAVFTVVFCHFQQRFLFVHFLVLPIDGVELFFVLSGFLITSLLLREREVTGRVDLASFYQRRSLRILPPLFVYLAVVVVVCLVLGQRPPWPSLLSSAFFMSDFYDHSFFTEHIWSLAIEEQFYLVWPLLMLWALKRGGKRFAAKVTLALIAASPLCRVGMQQSHVAWLAHAEGSIVFGRMDSLFAGCLVALWTGTRHMEGFFARTRRYWWLAPLFFFIVSPSLRLLGGNAYTFTLGYTCESLTMAYFIVWAARHAEHPVGRFLNLRPMVYLGVLSYSLYLYQSAPIHGWAFFPRGFGPIQILLTIAVLSLLSYYFVEKPALRLKRRKTEATATLNPV